MRRAGTCKSTWPLARTKSRVLDVNPAGWGALRNLVNLYGRMRCFLVSRIYFQKRNLIKETHKSGLGTKVLASFWLYRKFTFNIHGVKWTFIKFTNSQFTSIGKDCNCTIFSNGGKLRYISGKMDYLETLACKLTF